jgi:hypothetical protein
MNYEIKDIVFLYKELTDLATSYYDITYEIYNIIKYEYGKNKKSWSELMIDYVNNVTDENQNKINNIIKYIFAIDILCKQKIKDKIIFLQNHSSVFKNEIIDMALYYIDVPINLSNVVDIKKYITKIISVNVLLLNVCEYLYNVVSCDIKNAKSDIKNLKSKINNELDTIKAEKRKIHSSILNDKNYLVHKNSLYKQMFSLKKQLSESKIAILEEKRIKLYLEVKKNLYHIKFF